MAQDAGSPVMADVAIPSLRLLLDVPTPDLTVNATGKQWYWSYAYPDNGNFEFDSLIEDFKAVPAE
jgi:cytochrome c oxidase subunit 2